MLEIWTISAHRRGLTVLYQDGQTLLNQQCGVENNQTEAQRQYIITGADPQEIPDSLLRRCINRTISL